MNPLPVNVGVAVAAFGLMPVFKKAAIDNGTSALLVAWVTLVVAALTCILILILQRPSSLLCLVERRHVRPLAVVGVLAGGLVTLLVAHALSTTTATNRSLFQAAYPAATLLFAHLMLRERLAPNQYVGIAALSVGLLLMNGVGVDFRFGSGFWLLFLTLPLIGFSDVYGKRLTEHLSPLLLACGRNLYGALFLFVLWPWLSLGTWPETIDWVWLTGAGVCQGIGVWALYRALNTSKASLVASLVATAPLVAAGAELALLGLDLDLWQWLGVATVVAAAVWLGRGA
jgi:drug/metabolite transporter (DMT)-like permease